MFSSKADGYFHDVILIFSWSDIFHGVKFFTARRSFTRREKLYSCRGLFHDRVIYFHADSEEFHGDSNHFAAFHSCWRELSLTVKTHKSGFPVESHKLSKSVSGLH